MKLITEIEIENFRSIKKCKISSIKDFNALFGLNNSGKSNILRALNLFFNNETDKGQKLDFDSDFHQSLSKQRKEIKISVKFSLPQNFKFKTKLRSVEEFILGSRTDKTNREVKIKKIFGREYFFPEGIHLNGKPIEEKNLRNIERFLNLINFRYIPNRVLPVEILREESNAVKKAIARKLNQQKTSKKKIQNATESLSKAIRETSQKLIQPISDELKKLSHDNTTVELITPSQIEDLISTSGYFLTTDRVQVSDIYQGSGIQSFLMFHTLHLIDRDYAQQFGWKQATIWAVEEPESSLHSDLEAQLAMFLFKTVTNKDRRLQLFCTTHSTIFSEYSQLSALVKKSSTETECEAVDPKDLYQKVAESGISQYTHPLLFCPRQNILLCEGKIDVAFVKKVLKILEIDNSNLHITCLSDLITREEKGGKNTVEKYIREHKDVISLKYKFHQTKIIILFDWEEKIKLSENLKNMDGVSVIQWPEDKIKEKTKKIKGIESLYPERFFAQAMKQKNFKSALSRDGFGNYSYSAKSTDEKNKLKNYLSKKVNSDLTKKDVEYLKDFIKQKIIQS